MLGFLGLLILGLLVSLGIIAAQLGSTDTITAADEPVSEVPADFLVSR